MRKYSIIMTNEDDGFRTEIDNKGTKKQMLKKIKAITDDMRADNKIKLVDYGVNYVEGYGSRGHFLYMIVGVKI
jgi:hypothetical protein